MDRDRPERLADFAKARPDSLTAPPPSRDELVGALARLQSEQLARLLTVTLGLCAELHPEEVRKALGQVFDVSALEDVSRRAVLVASQAQEAAYAAAAEVREVVTQIHRDLDGLEARIDALNYELDRRPAKPKLAELE